MMSTSYNNSATRSLSADAKAFVYQDSGRSFFNADVVATQVAERPEEKPSKAENLPRISEDELSRLLAEARAEGSREGGRQAREGFEQEIARLRRQVADLASSFQQERAEYYSKVEVELVHLALAIAARILHREAQVDRTVVAGLAKVMLDKLQQGTKAVLRVRPEEASGWRHYFHENPDLQVAEDASLEPGGCFLETELGTADMGLNAQLKEVEKGFFDLLAQRPEPR
jgi:flagellar assembly protein FliH